MTWKVKKAEWSPQDEALYSNFIKKLGYSKCNTTDKCLAGEGNILRTEEDMLFTHYSDCADSQDKKEWHALQQFLRNNLEKDTAAVQGWALVDLEHMNEHKEVDNNPNAVRYKIGPKLEAM